MIASSHLQVELKVAFIDVATRNKQPHTVLHAIRKAADVDVVLASHHHKVGLLPHFVLRKEVLVETVLLEVVLEIFSRLHNGAMYFVFLADDSLRELVNLNEMLLELLLGHVHIHNL